MANKRTNRKTLRSHTLRERAEELLRVGSAAISTPNTGDVLSVVQELLAQQMELESQNEELRQIQIDLAQSCDQYADLYEFAPVGYVTLLEDGRVIEANRAAAALLGVERRMLLDSDISDYVAPASRDEMNLHRQAIFATGRDGSGASAVPRTGRHTCELELTKRDGTLLTIRLESNAYAAGARRCCRTALIDVTDLHQARAQLEANERRYRRLTDAVTDCVFRVRVEDGRAMETMHGVNCEAMTGYTPEEFQEDPWLWIAMVPVEDRAIVEGQVADILAGREVARIEHRIVRKDGHVRWVAKTVSPEYDQQGELIAYDGLLRDITPRKEAEIALRHLNETLEQQVTEQTQEIRLLAEAVARLGEGVLITNDHLDWPGPHIVFVNEALCRITGYSAGELIGQSPRILQGEESDRETLDHIRTELSAGRSCSAEVINYRKDGTSYDAEIFITPLFNAEGRRTNFVSVHRDVTERKRTEAALRESEERFRLFMDNSPAVAWMKDESGRYVYLSRTFEEHFDVRLDDWRGKTDFDLWPREVAEEFRHNDLQVLKRNTPFEVVEEAPNPDGSLSSWRVFKVPFQESTGERYVGGMAVDITERKQAEEAVREREERMRAILNTAADAIITIDRSGIIKSVNRATEQMFGYALPELVGENVKMLMPAPFHDEHDGYLARYLRTGDPRIIGVGRQVFGRRSDGRIFPVDLAISEVEHLGLFTGVIRDISERKRLEGELLTIAGEEQRRIGQDLHDYTGQELTALLLTADTLLEEADEGGTTDGALLRKLRDGLQRVAAQVRAYSRGLIPVEVDAEGLQAALNELASGVSETHHVECTFACAEAVSITSNTVATHLYRIAQEAVTNAIRHAAPSRVSIDLRQNNANVILRICDDGVGMRDEPAGNAGMGLRIMQHRANLIQGQLIVGPRADCGTEVRCTVMKGA